MSDHNPVEASNTTMRILNLVGFCGLYGTYEGREWTLRMDDVNQDNALDASARLCTGILLTSFPEYQCDRACDDLYRMVEPIETTFGPFDGQAMHTAMNTVLYG